MGHVEDRWHKTVRHAGGRSERVKTELFGKKSFPDRAKREADAFLVSTESDKLRGTYVDPLAGRMTFAEYAETWLRTRSFDESTRESTEYRVRKHLLRFFGSRKLAEIKPGHIREWDAAMDGKLAPATRAVVFAHLRTILGAAVDDERIVKNPCSAKSVKPPRPVQRRVVPRPGTSRANGLMVLRSGSTATALTTARATRSSRIGSASRTNSRWAELRSDVGAVPNSEQRKSAVARGR